MEKKLISIISSVPILYACGVAEGPFESFGNSRSRTIDAKTIGSINTEGNQSGNGGVGGNSGSVGVGANGGNSGTSGVGGMNGSGGYEGAGGCEDPCVGEQGPKGDKGDKGDQGPPGPQGPPGLDGTCNNQCNGMSIYLGMSNKFDPNNSALTPTGKIQYGGLSGFSAGDKMCQDVYSDPSAGMCTYEKILDVVKDAVGAGGNTLTDLNQAFTDLDCGWTKYRTNPVGSTIFQKSDIVGCKGFYDQTPTDGPFMFLTNQSGASHTIYLWKKDCAQNHPILCCK